MGRLFGSRVSVKLKLWKWLATGIHGSLDPPKKEHNKGFAAGNGGDEQLEATREARVRDNGRRIDLIAPKPIWLSDDCDLAEMPTLETEEESR